MNLFTGVWRLVSYEARWSDGCVHYPFGEHATGMLVYTADGHMTGQVMRSGRKHLPSGYRKAGVVENALDAFDGYIAYCGRYRVEESTSEIVHIVEASLYPNWTGGEQRRRYSLQGDVLTLEAARPAKDKTVVNRLVWRRAR
ncbi:MAG: lipocalin-like domain-containing protein [Candidatus Solibacter usitatus]|nr:lipocalin-like domain-containing protein [Candidatus Solibacter usitatus]